MKTTLSFFSALLISVLTLYPAPSAAQSDEKEKKTKVKIVIKDDGKTTVAETDTEKSGRHATAVTKTLVIDDDGTKKLTVTTVKDGKKETIEMEGEEVDNYLKEHDNMKAGAKAYSRSMVHIMADDDDDDVEIAIDVDELLEEAGIEIEATDGKGKVIIKSSSGSGTGFSFSFSSTDGDGKCSITLKGLDETIKAICKELEGLDIDIEVMDNDNEKVMVKTITGKGGKKTKTVIIKE